MSPTKQPPAEAGAPINDVPSVGAPEVGVAASQMGKVAGHPHRNNKKLAVIVTIIVALLLAAIAVYVYVSTNNNTETTTAQATTNTTAQETTTTTTATTVSQTDIDQTLQEVESLINGFDDSLDFAESLLSDSSLGL